MYNLNELTFEAMLECAKRASKGNPLQKLAVDSISYEYNRNQYNACIQGINYENEQIRNIYNRISQRGGYSTSQDLLELKLHMQKRQEYEMKCMKHFISGGKDVDDMIREWSF